jgi:hypothetical protein
MAILQNRLQPCDFNTGRDESRGRQCKIFRRGRGTGRSGPEELTMGGAPDRRMVPGSEQVHQKWSQAADYGTKG